MSARRRFLGRAAALACSAPAALAAFGQAPAQAFDLVVKGGRVIDPARDLHGVLDIGIRAGRIAAVETDIPDWQAARAIDARGRLVTPGLIDLHAHLFAPGTPIGLGADELARQSCVTTFASAGDAGAANFAAFRRHAASQRRCRVYAFVNIARTGLSAHPGELRDIGAADVEQAARTIADNHDIVLGVAVRQSQAAVGANGLEPLRRAIAAVERAGTRTRVLCHLGNVPGELAALLEMLRPRDIVTHVYSSAGNDQARDGRRVDAMLAARRRGVVIDVGHGGIHFDFALAEPAIARGLIPDVVSSGAHAWPGHPGGVPLLPRVMSELLHLGLSLEQVIAMTTVNPARIIGREPGLGTLALGAPADLAILELVEGPVRFTDARGNLREGRQWLRPIRALRAGVPILEAGEARS